MTPDQLEHIENVAKQARRLLHTIEQLTEGINGAHGCEGVEILFGPPLKIMVRRGDEWTNVCWADNLLRHRAGDLLGVLLQILIEERRKAEADLADLDVDSAVTAESSA